MQPKVYTRFLRWSISSHFYPKEGNYQYSIHVWNSRLKLSRHRTLSDRVLRMCLRPSRRSARIDVSYEFMNRQMVWHAFTVEIFRPFIPTSTCSTLNCRNFCCSCSPSSIDERSVVWHCSWRPSYRNASLGLFCCCKISWICHHRSKTMKQEQSKENMQPFQNHNVLSVLKMHLTPLLSILLVCYGRL